MVAPRAILTTLLFHPLQITFADKPKAWRHGWKNVAEMTYMHGGTTHIIDGDALKFAAKHYPAIGLANCAGRKDGSQEDAALISARRFRKINPDVINVFYWKASADSEVEKCSSASRVFKQHKEWTVAGAKQYYDFANPAVQTFFKNHLLSLAYEMDEVNKKPLIDAFYMDGYPTNNYTDIPTDDDPDAAIKWSEGARKTIRDFQTELNYLGFNQYVIINGLDGPKNVKRHSDVALGSMVDHFAILQFLDRKTGDWKVDKMETLLFDTVRSPLNEGRTLLIKAWPGPIVHQKDKYPKTMEQPKTPEQKRALAQFYLPSALALFLLVADDTMWFSYSWFWGDGSYIPFGDSHTCPDEFYPTFQCPLGEPLGPPRNGTRAHVYTREYEHASVYVDLKDHDGTRVFWKKGDPKWCPGAPATTNYVDVAELSVNNTTSDSYDMDIVSLNSHKNLRTITNKSRNSVKTYKKDITNEADVTKIDALNILNSTMDSFEIA